MAVILPTIKALSLHSIHMTRLRKLSLTIF